jgi:hypothetical protein
LDQFSCIYAGAGILANSRSNRLQPYCWINRPIGAKQNMPQTGSA